MSEASFTCPLVPPGMPLIVPPILLQDWPNTLVSNQVCTHQCFKYMSHTGGMCGGYYDEKDTIGIPLWKPTMERIAQALSAPCFIAQPQFLPIHFHDYHYDTIKGYPQYSLALDILLGYMDITQVEFPPLRIEAGVSNQAWMDNYTYVRRLVTYERIKTETIKCGLGEDGCTNDKILQWLVDPPKWCVTNDSLGLIELLRKLNITECWLGVETADTMLLERYGKKHSVQAVEVATKQVRRIPAKVGWYLVTSNYDTPKTLQATVELAVKHKPDSIYVSVVDADTDEGFSHIFAHEYKDLLEHMLTEAGDWWIASKTP